MVLEDLADLTGLVLATLGLALTVATGSSVWDGVASIGIGALLILVAANLVGANASLCWSAGRCRPRCNAISARNSTRCPR